ncbi:hypothetical protein PRIC2_006332 [Phytophthora ramorum]
MSTEGVHATQVSEKDAMTTRPEADEDARTESSEGSNTQPDAADSEDEFEDARPPSSTSSMLMVFDGSAPPLSGVYEDALEATEEQVAAALGSTSSDGGRQTTILEGDEEGEEEVENVIETEDAATTEVNAEVLAVIQGMLEAAVAADEDVAEDDVPAAQDLAVDTGDDVAADKQGSAEEAENEVVAIEDAEESEAACVDQTQEEETNEDANEEAKAKEGAKTEEEAVVGCQESEEENFVEATAEECEDVEQAVGLVKNDTAEVNTEQNVDVEPVDEANADDEEVSSTVVKETEGQEAAETGVAPQEEPVSGDLDEEATEETVVTESEHTAVDSVVAGSVAAQDEADSIVEVAGPSPAAETTKSESPVGTEEPTATDITGEEEVVAEVTESDAVVDETAVDEQIGGIEESVVEVEETAVEDSPEADAAVDTDNVDMASGEETAEAEPAALAAMDPAGKSEEAAEEEGHDPEAGDEADPADEQIEDEGDEAPVKEAVGASGAGEVATEDGVMEKPVADEVAQEESIASTEEATVSADEAVDDAGSDANPGGEEALVEDLKEAVQTEECTGEPSGEESSAAADVEEVVIQVANDLVEAVQSEQDTDEVVEADSEATVEEPLEDKPDAEDATSESTGAPEQDNEAASLNSVATKEDPVDNNAEHLAVDGDIAPKQDPAEEEAEAEAAPLSNAPEPAAVTKEPTGSYSKSGDADDQDQVVLGLLPRLGPSTGTTTTTTIEPFILSTESVEVHLPPQRWIYEVYGFSIESRVVYYHIHKTNRRTGIRDPPILKRYTDFRELQLQLLDTCLHAAADMPRIPRPHLGTVFRGYKSKKTIEVREKAFRALLRYISQYPALHGSGAFERFIETNRATPGAGWM